MSNRLDKDGWVPFPVHVLPTTLCEYAVATARGIGADPSMVILPALAAAAGSAGNAVRLQVNNAAKPWREPSALWVGAIVQQGSNKTQCLEAAIEPLQDIQRRHDRAYTADLVRFEQELAASKRGSDPANLPHAPTRKQVLFSDSTPEALRNVLSENPRGMTGVYDELQTLFGGTTRYTGRGAADVGMAFLRSAFSGTPFTGNRAGGGEGGKGKYIRIDRPLVSIAGCVQPSAFEAIISTTLQADGTASRFMWFQPPSEPSGWIEEYDHDPVVVAGYARMVEHLTRLPLCESAVGHEAEPLTLRLAPDANQTARQWVNENARAIRDASGVHRGGLAKMKGICFRLALAFHLCDHASGDGGTLPMEVTGETLQRAIEVAQWASREQGRVYAMMEQTEQDREDLEVMAWIRKQGRPVTAYQLSRGQRKFRENSQAAELFLQQLVRGNKGEWIADDHEGGPGAPARRFRLWECVSCDNTDFPSILEALSHNPPYFNGEIGG